MIHVRYAIARKGLPAALAFRTWADAALRGARRRGPVEIGIRLVDGTEGRELNQHYRGKAYATNVLSFAAELPAGIRLPLLGDVVICAPVIALEAAEQGKSLRDHYAHMTIHGVLHLLGYDHIDATEATRMERLERRILAGLSVADPY